MPFIAFEGLDGSGKTSLIRSLSEKLKTKGIGHVVSREPGGTPLGDELRQILLRREGDAPVPRAELCLYEAIRAQHVDRLIRPALTRGDWVLCDRYTASSVAFQANGRHLAENDIAWLNNFATAGLKPDLTVLLDVPVATSQARRQKRHAELGDEADRFEVEPDDFHQRVRQSYLNQAKAESKSWLVISADQTPEKIQDVFFRALKERKWLDF